MYKLITNTYEILIYPHMGSHWLHSSMQLGTPQVPFYVLKPCWRWNLGSAFFYLSRCCPRLAPQRSKKKNRAVMTVRDQTAALGPRSIEERSISDLETNQRSQQRNCQTRCNLTPSGWIRIQNLCAQFGASTEHRSWIWITCGSFAASAATREVQPFTLFPADVAGNRQEIRLGTSPRPRVGRGSSGQHPATRLFFCWSSQLIQSICFQCVSRHWIQSFFSIDGMWWLRCKSAPNAGHVGDAQSAVTPSCEETNGPWCLLVSMIDWLIGSKINETHKWLIEMKQIHCESGNIQSSISSSTCSASSSPS